MRYARQRFIFTSMETKEINFWNRVDSLVNSQFDSLTEYCETAGIHYGTMISQRARGSIPKIDQLITMAHSLEITVDELVTGDPPPVISRENLNPSENLDEIVRLANEMNRLSREKLEIIKNMIHSWGDGHNEK